MATYITIETTEGVHVVKSVHPTSALATAAAAKEPTWVVVADAITDNVEPGWYYTEASGSAPASVAPLGPPDTLAERLQHLRELWRTRDREFTDLWGDETLYRRWVALNCAACAVDANVMDNDSYEVLLTEALQPGALWYAGHDAAAWTSYATGSFSENYYSTDTNGAGTLHSNITLTTEQDFNWVKWLYELE